MTESTRTRRPGPGMVIWGSIALFAAIFALLTSQLAASQPPPPRPVLVRQVVKRRVVTTIVPTPGRSTVTSSGQAAASVPTTGYAPVTTSAS
jgi:hypothetical protein